MHGLLETDVTLAILGDSIPYNILTAGYFPEAVNLCVPGAKPADFVGDGVYASTFAQALALFPRFLHLHLGTNAVETDVDKLAAAATILDMALTARAKGIMVLLAKITPRGWDITLFNDTMQANATQYGFRLANYYDPFVVNGQLYADLFESDQTHPNACGKVVQAGVLAPHITSMAGYARLIATMAQEAV